MCGIAGILNWSGTTAQDKSHTAMMMGKLAHRGPDAEGLKQLDWVTLGHRRLSILDLSNAANQPMCDPTKRYWIIFNGEIYNFKTLKKQLINLGLSFKTNSDTEVILLAFAKWGIKAVEKLVGMFAFALWDAQEKALFLGRDRLGEKPLFYMPVKHQDNLNGMVFGSELKALLCHPQAPRQICNKALNQYLSLNYILTESCILNGVIKVPPATIVCFKQGQKPFATCYWDLSDYFKRKNHTISKKEACIKLQHLIDKSVSSQMISDVPLGAFLSGGIDSSAIVKSMTLAHQKEQIHTFSIGFQEKTYCELKQSKTVAHYLGVDHATKVVVPQLLDCFRKIIYAADEPFADTSMLPTYFLAQFAREKVTVCLSGDGGDELFLGYETYLADRFRYLFRVLPQSCFKLAAGFCNRVIPVSFDKVSLEYKVKKFLKGCLYDPITAHCFWRSIFSQSDKLALLKNKTLYDPRESFLRFSKPVSTCHYLDQMSFIDLKTWLVDDILVKVDRMSMAHSLETRTPFLDHRLVEFAASLPVSFKLWGWQKKHILKQAMKNRLPDSILAQKKQGFSAPMAHWLNGDLAVLAKEITLDFSLSTWFNRAIIQRLWLEHEKKQQDNSLKLFSLMCFGVWVEQFMTINQEVPDDLSRHTCI